jgi:hypothetical protein
MSWIALDDLWEANKPTSAGSSMARARADAQARQRQQQQPKKQVARKSKGKLSPAQALMKKRSDERLAAQKAKAEKPKPKPQAPAAAGSSANPDAPSNKAAGTGGEKLPATLTHCMLAVRKKGHKTMATWNICRAHLTRHGYLKGPYKEGDKVSSVRQTAKGAKRSMYHAMEKGGVGPQKYAAFQKMFGDIAKKVQG